MDDAVPLARSEQGDVLACAMIFETARRFSLFNHRPPDGETNTQGSAPRSFRAHRGLPLTPDSVAVEKFSTVRVDEISTFQMTNIRC
jgi:hypothetical protein